VENGKWKLTFKPGEIKPLKDWLFLQGRFKHLQKPENKNIVEELQNQVTKKWEELLVRCGEAS